MDLKEVREEAKRELEAEAFRRAVDEMKAKLLEKKGFWDWFPYTITIKRKVKKDA